MRQFDVHQNPSERSRPIAPYVIVLQSHHLAAAPTVIVAPLILSSGPVAYTEISVVTEFQGANYAISVGELAGVHAHLLQRPIGNLAQHEDAIRRALDRIFTGF